MAPTGEAFRAHVQQIFAEELPSGWKGIGAIEDRTEADAFVWSWRDTMLRRGLLGLQWPVEYGGQGLTKLEQVILVDRNDTEIGRADKLPAHRLGYLHRAVSICVIDDQGRMLLQRRAAEKYHSTGLWTNACCSHPRPGEATDGAALRRLPEELGFSCPLVWAAQTHYRADVGAGLTEDELVHIFLGLYNGEVNPDPHEVDGVMWATYDFLKADISSNPQNYTYWFKHYIATFGRKLFEIPRN